MTRQVYETHRHCSRRAWAVAIAVLTLVAAERMAHADGSRPEDEALTLNQGAVDAYVAGRPEAALELLQKASQLAPTEPRIWLNLGKVHESLGDLKSAVAAYERFLELAPPDAVERPATQRKAKALEALLAKPPAKEPVPPPPPPPPPPRRSASAAPWIVAGAGVLVTAGGLVFGALAQSRHDDAVGEQDGPTAQRLQSDATSFATIANVGIVIGIVTTVAGAGWGVLDVRAAKRTATAGFPFTF